MVVTPDKADADLFDTPATTEEQVLASFLDTAIDEICRGAVPSLDGVLGQAPQLHNRAERLVLDLGLICNAAAELWLHSGMSTASAPKAGHGPITEHDSFDPFPNEFRVICLMGSGAFSEVWLVEDLNLGRRVALKRLRLSIRSSDQKSLDALRSEGKFLVQVDHPNIVRVYAWRQSGDEHFLVLQFVDGGSLGDRLDKEGPIPWDEAARYVADVGDGLQQVHRFGIVHRDIKPANILLNTIRDEALLTDFGLSARLQQVENIAGSRPYMAPEVFRGEVTEAVDVYALAASLFQLITNEVPFPARSLSELLEQATCGLRVPDPRCKQMPEPIETLVRAGLQPEPSGRPILSEFVTQLRSSLNQLLADSLSIPLAGASSFSSDVDIRLLVSRRRPDGVFAPVAATSQSSHGFLRDLKRVPAPPQQVSLRTGDRVRIEAVSSHAGFLTVFNVGPTGNLNILFPEDLTAATRTNPLEVNRPVHIADVDVTPPPGLERLCAVWTRNLLSFRPDELVAIAERGTPSVSTQYRATRDMVRVQSTLQSLKPEDWHAVVLELKHSSCEE